MLNGPASLPFFDEAVIPDLLERVEGRPTK